MSADFVSQMWPHAVRVSQQTGLDPRLVVAQSALETGWGRSAPGNNYFGIKSHGKSGGNNLGTWEVVNGQRVNINDSFRAYDGMSQSADGYAQFLQENPRYKPMLSANGLDAQIEALSASGYATDPQYGSKVRSIAEGITPPSQDIADEAMAVLGLPPMSSAQRAPAGSTAPRSTISTRGPEPMAEYQPEKASGLLGMLFPNMTADRQDRLVMGLSGMAMNPNRGLQEAAMGRMDERRGRRAQFEQDRKQREQVNKTTAYIENQVRAGNLPPELMEMARVDPVGALRASQEIILRQPEPTYQQVRGSDLGLTGPQADMMFNRAPDGKITQVGGGGVNIYGDQLPPPDAELRSELFKDQAASLTAIVDAGTKAATVRSDLEALRELAQVAPSGPLEGRFAEMFPEFDDAAAARQAIIKRVAPTLRVEGSGSTSDIEYAGMIEGMGRLTNSPEANAAIADMMLAKSELDLQRAEIVSAYQSGKLKYNDLLSRLNELNRTSIMPDSLKRLLGDVRGTSEAPIDADEDMPTFNLETGIWE